MTIVQGNRGRGTFQRSSRRRRSACKAADPREGMAVVAGMARCYFNTSRLISSFMISEVPP